MDQLLNGVRNVFKHFKPQPLTVTVEGEHYKLNPQEYGLAVGDHIRKPGPIAKPTLVLQTLTGFIDAYKANVDGFQKGAIHVIDHLTVALKSLEADDFGRRHEWVRTVCGEPAPFPFNEYMVPETFLIKLQSGFLPTENVIALQRFASALSSESSISTQDDGFSQTVLVNEGGVKKADIPLPSRLGLLAYRTFREIDPVDSEFIVRLKAEKGQLPKIALLEVDAGRWKLDSIGLVAKYLQKALPDAVVIA